jgi:hypothetical protein
MFLRELCLSIQQIVSGARLKMFTIEKDPAEEAAEAMEDLFLPDVYQSL